MRKGIRIEAGRSAEGRVLVSVRLKLKKKKKKKKKWRRNGEEMEKKWRRRMSVQSGWS